MPESDHFTEKAVSALTVEGVDRDSAAISAMTIERAQLYDCGNSVKTQTIKSQVDKLEQVSQDRFEPYRFNVEQQTTPDLIEQYVKKSTDSKEMATEPIKIIEEKKIAMIVIQTEPIIHESELLLEPFTTVMPLDHILKAENEM
jgi:hypothetical protein